jgi:hypothetical protein
MRRRRILKLSSISRMRTLTKSDACVVNSSQFVGTRQTRPRSIYQPNAARCCGKARHFLSRPSARMEASIHAMRRSAVPSARHSRCNRSATRKASRYARNSTVDSYASRSAETATFLAMRLFLSGMPAVSARTRLQKRNTAPICGCSELLSRRNPMPYSFQSYSTFISIRCSSRTIGFSLATVRKISSFKGSGRSPPRHIHNPSKLTLFTR